MKNHFFFSYCGNKRNEVENIYNILKDKLDNAEYIVEPFAGSTALSYYIWLKNPEKQFKYIINDNDELLIELYKIAQDETKFNKLFDDLKILFESIKNKDDYNKLKKEKSLINYIFLNRVFLIHPGLYPSDPKRVSIKLVDRFKNAPIVEFLRKADITFSSIDALEIYKNYKSMKNAFIFLDPPYLASGGNSLYNHPGLKIFEYLFDNKIKNEPSFIILCLENIWIIKLLFNDNKSITYDKLYQMTKKKTEHIIIHNR